MILDLEDKRFSMLVATNQMRSGKRRPKRLCYCDCGRETWVLTSSLLNGNTKSCGCRKKRGSRRLADGVAAKNVVLAKYKSHAQERNLSWRLSIKSFNALVRDVCFFCGTAPKTIQRSKGGNFVYNGIDRLNNDAGYSKANCVSCCFTCNRAKADMSLGDFMNWIKKLKLCL